MIFNWRKRNPTDPYAGDVFVVKYGLGLSALLFVALIWSNKPDPALAFLLSSPLIIAGLFFLTVARAKPSGNFLAFRRFAHWHKVPYDDVLECRERWAFGYFRLHRYVFPWGGVYFVRPRSSTSLFGWDEEVIRIIRKKARLP